MRIPTLCSIVALSAATALSAQAADPLPARSTLDSLFAEHGRVRVVTAETTLVARQPKIEGDRLQWLESPVAGIAVADIREIQVYASRFGRGAAIGGAIGGLLSLLAQSTCGSIFTCSIGDRIRNVTFLVGVGALFGGVIGVAKSRWETVYPRSAR